MISSYDIIIISYHIIIEYDVILIQIIMAIKSSDMKL